MATRQRPGAPTLLDVARVAGVSRATASRVINGGQRVSPEAMAAVQAAVTEVGYRPNRAARTLVTRRTDQVAVVVPESDQVLFSDPFFATVLHGVTSALSHTEMQTVLVLAEKGGPSERLDAYLRGGHYDGAIVVSHHRADGVAELLSHAPVPSVFIGRPWSPQETPVSYVDVDNLAGGRLAAEHLLARGARAPAVISGPRDMGVAVDRITGWRAGLAAAGRPPAAEYVADFSLAGGTVATERLLDEHPEVDAVFVSSDLMASAALRVLRARGRRVPQDVRVVGFDDLELARTTEPPLTTLVNPAQRLGRDAVAMLLAALDGDDELRSRVLPTELVVRASS